MNKACELVIIIIIKLEVTWSHFLIAVFNLINECY